EIGADEAGFVSGPSAGGNPARVAARNRVNRVADAIWTAQRADQGIWRDGGDGSDGASRAAVCGQHPDERSGVPLRGDNGRAGARRYRRKRSAAGGGETTTAPGGNALPG